MEDAKWIYDNCIPGTKVEFYSSATPGPLGKPSARKISGDEAVRNWDPTDPDKNNPWKEYLKNQSKPADTKPTTGNNLNTGNKVENTQSKNETLNNIKDPDKKPSDPTKNEGISKNEVENLNVIQNTGENM